MDSLDRMVVLSLVKPSGRRWPLEAAIVTRLAQLRGGGFLSAPIADEWTGAGEVVCRRALLSLDQRKIICRDAGESGQDHIRWCAVNDNYRRWQVEWLLEPSQIPAKLAHAAQQRDESPLTRIFARSYSARSVARIARSYDARSWETDMAEVAGIARNGIARSAEGGVEDRAIRTARSLGRRRAVLERAILGGSPEEGSHSSRDDENPPPAAATRSEEVVDPGTQALVGRILQLSVPAPGARGRYLTGAPRRALDALIELHGLERMGVALERVGPGELSPVRIVEALGALVLVEELLDEQAIGTAVDPSVAVSHLRRMIATHEEAGFEPSKDLLDQLARWQTEPSSPPQEVNA